MTHTSRSLRRRTSRNPAAVRERAISIQTLVACLGLSCCGCEAPVPHRGLAPGAPNGLPSGLYEVTLHLPVTGTLTCVVAARADVEQGVFVANSRPGAVGELVGGGAGASLNLWAGGSLKYGAFLRASGRRTAEGGLQGRLITPFLSATFAASLDQPMPLLDDSERLAGYMQWRPTRQEDHPRSHLAAVVTAIAEAMREHLFDPALYPSEATQLYLRELDRDARRARDDFEFALGAYLAARRLPYSHVALTHTLDLPETPSAIRMLAAPTGQFIPLLTQPAIRLQRVSGVAVLRIEGFLVRKADIDFVFADLIANPPKGLVLDLRDTPGGTFATLHIAARMLSQPQEVGMLVDPAARATVLAGLNSDFPVQEDCEAIDTIRQRLRTSHALRLRVLPRPPVYEGPVIVLTSSGTASAAEVLTELLQRVRRAKVLGTRTAGLVLSAETYDVGQGWQLTLPAYDFLSPGGVRLEGAGVRPDQTVRQPTTLQTAIEELSSAPGVADSRPVSG